MDLLNYLKEEPRARERANKNRVIGNLIMMKYRLGTDKAISKDKMDDIVGEILNLDRKWRLILRDNPDLRGSDYKDKDRLEEQKLIELGYETNITP
jgi:hypothetical protein